MNKYSGQPIYSHWTCHKYCHTNYKKP